jgi:hypothetical protein
MMADKKTAKKRAKPKKSSKKAVPKKKALKKKAKPVAKKTAKAAKKPAAKKKAPAKKRASLKQKRAEAVDAGKLVTVKMSVEAHKAVVANAKAEGISEAASATELTLTGSGRKRALGKYNAK